MSPLKASGSWRPSLSMALIVTVAAAVDFPYRAERYSAARRLAAAGHVTLALDWLGAGESDHPPTAELVPDVNISALDQVCQPTRE